MNRTNNFDFLRLLFAFFVIISHSFILSGAENCDWLCKFTNGRLYFSYLGLRGFFVISGFLIFQSLERSKGVVDYYWKRFLRIFPGLFFVLLITVMLSLFVYEGGVLSYFTNISIWTYIPNNLSLYNLQYNIQGVFENNPYKSAINGSLWTLCYEFSFYIILSLLIFLKSTNTKKILIFLGYFCLLIVNSFYFDRFPDANLYSINSKYVLDFGFYFMSGSLLAATNINKSKHLNYFLYGFLFLFIVTVFYNLSLFLFYLSLPFIITALGLKSFPVINNLGNKIGDFSYGVYIYAFPIQQALMYYFDLRYLNLIFYSTVLSLVAGYFSWNLIEKKFMKFKNR